jgi:HEAT repeat protein
MALFSSNWPVCNEIADALAEIATPDAKAALIGALKVRRHHVRSAAIKALLFLPGNDVAAAVAGLKDDPSYEVRQDVARALELLRSGEGGSGAFVAKRACMP